eukprot:gene5671-7828_t
MGLLFYVFGYLAGYVAILLLALAISAGLYLLAELAEEYPTMTGKIIKIALISALVLHLLLWIDGLNTFESLFGFCAHLVYGTMLQDFPFVKLLSLPSIASLVLFFVTNIIWLQYFMNNSYDILQIFGFFVILVWMIPCALFVSLSINDNTLPTMNAGTSVSEGNITTSNSKKKGIFRVSFDYISQFVDGMYISVLFNARKILESKRK